MNESKATFMQIDVQNLFYAARSKGQRVDFEKIWQFFHERQAEFLTDAILYMIRSVDFDSSKFETKMKSVGYNLRIKQAIKVRTKPAESIICKKCGAAIETRPIGIQYKQSNHDVLITVDAIDRMNAYDKLILMSGDGDFTDLCKYLKENGKQIEIWSFKESYGQSTAPYADRMYFMEDNFFYKKPNVNIFGFNWKSEIKCEIQDQSTEN